MRDPGSIPGRGELFFSFADLFKNAIPMAHSAESQFLFRSKESVAKIGKEYARSIGWKGKDSDTEGLFYFMKKQPIHKLEFSLTVSF